jgi:hypothetical protein
MMDDRKLLMAYLAGVMDGDGSFSLLRLKKGSKNYLYAPMLQCASWRLEFIHLLKETFGGNLVKGKMHINKKGEETHALTYWKLRSNRNCLGALLELKPYLRIKKNRASNLLAFIKFSKFVRGKQLGEDVLIIRESQYDESIRENSWEFACRKIFKPDINDSEEVSWSYIAGIWDTDGSFSIKKQVSNKGTHVINPRYLPVISLGMTDTRAINYVMAIFPEGKLYNPKNAYTKYKTHYQFGIYTKNECVSFLTKIIPYLRSKKQNALELLKFCKESRNTGYCKAGIPKEELQFREECYQNLCHLNKYGVYKPSLIDLETRRGDRAEAE